MAAMISDMWFMDVHLAKSLLRVKTEEVRIDLLWLTRSLIENDSWLRAVEVELLACDFLKEVPPIGSSFSPSPLRSLNK